MATADQIERALAGPTVPTRWAMMHVNRRNQLVSPGDISAALLDGGRLELDNSREVITTGNIVVRRNLLPDPLDHIKLIEQRYIHDADEWVDFSLGLFKPMFTTGVFYEDDDPLIEMRLEDLTGHLVASTTQDAYTIPAETPYRDAIITILEDFGFLHNIPAGGVQTLFNHTWPMGTPWYEILRVMADGINYFAPFPNNNGVFQLVEKMNPASFASNTTYSDAADAVKLIDAASPYKRPLDQYAWPNLIAGVIDDPRYLDILEEEFPDLIGIGAVVFVNDCPNCPISTQFVDPDKTELNSDSRPSTKAILDINTLTAMVRYTLREIAAKAIRSDLNTFPDPRRGPHEYYTLNIDGVESNKKFMVLSWRRELSPGGEMRHTLGRADPVSLTQIDIEPPPEEE